MANPKNCKHDTTTYVRDKLKSNGTKWKQLVCNQCRTVIHEWQVSE